MPRPVQRLKERFAYVAIHVICSVHRCWQLQHSQLVGLLDDAANTTFSELGAGKGYLALMIARATEACHFIINDNQTFKLKADRILRRLVREGVKHTAFVRCQADLKDFVIGGALEELQASSSSASDAPQMRTPWKVVGVGKHLCGGATDYALRSLLSYKASGSAAPQGGARQLAGLCIAPCCHHRCTWQAYVGKDVLMELGLSQREIELAFWMAGERSFPGYCNQDCRCLVL